jgi:hypothetical protein
MSLVNDIKKYKIYALCEPCSKIIRYIGLTGDSLKRRYYDHYKCSVNTKKSSWVKSKKIIGLRPKLIIIENNLTLHEAKSKEIYYISYYKSLGLNLVNGTSGGDGLFNPSVEVRKKIGDAHRGKKISPEHINVLKKLGMNRIWTKEQREKASLSNKGKLLSEATKEKLSYFRKNTPFSEKHIENIRKSKKKIKGIKISEERRLNMIGRKRSIEAKNKHSISMKLHFANMDKEKRNNINKHFCKLSEHELKEMIVLKRNGYTYSFLAKKYNITAKTVYLNLIKQGYEPNNRR